jgi:cation:H+ antiporter
MEYILLILGFIFLIKWADILIDWSSSIASKLWVSQLLIWLTIVAFWTSAPEFIVNIFSVSRWHTDLAVWNIMWSIIVNTLFVLWVSAIIYPLQAKSSTVHKEVPFLLLALIALLITANDVLLNWWTQNIITKNEWLLLILFFIIFIVYTFSISSKNSQTEPTKLLTLNKSIWYIVFWMMWLVYWWHILVESAKTIATNYWISESIIWLTIVAIWTSLPELAASAIAAYKKNADIAIWNVVWSNIYWVFLILWSSAATADLVIWKWLSYDIIIAFIVTFILTLILFFWWGKWKITKNEWIIMILLYIIYIWYLFVTQI